MYYAVVAWKPLLGGGVIDYGTFPKQTSDDFTVHTAKKTLEHIFPDEHSTYAAQLNNGLTQLVEKITGQQYISAEGSVYTIRNILIDSQWSESKDTVYNFCRSSQHRGILYPAHGKFYGAKSSPMNTAQPKPGERVGHHWRIPPTKKVSDKTGQIITTTPHVVIDTNYWKSLIAERLMAPDGSPHRLSIFGNRGAIHRNQHNALLEHLSSERSVEVEANGVRVAEWEITANGRDNHWLDCIVGSAVGASMIGIKPTAQVDVVRRKRVSVKELQKRRRTLQ